VSRTAQPDGRTHQRWLREASFAHSAYFLRSCDKRCRTVTQAPFGAASFGGLPKPLDRSAPRCASFVAIPRMWLWAKPTESTAMHPLGHGRGLEHVNDARQPERDACPPDVRFLSFFFVSARIGRQNIDHSRFRCKQAGKFVPVIDDCRPMARTNVARQPISVARSRLVRIPASSDLG
jgi:hypothetical protein